MAWCNSSGYSAIHLEPLPRTSCLKQREFESRELVGFYQDFWLTFLCEASRRMLESLWIYLYILILYIYTYILNYILYSYIFNIYIYIYLYSHRYNIFHFLYVYITYYTQESPGSESLYPIYGCVIFEFPRCDQRREHFKFRVNIFWETLFKFWVNIFLETLLEDQPELRFVWTMDSFGSWPISYDQIMLGLQDESHRAFSRFHR